MTYYYGNVIQAAYGSILVFLAATAVVLPITVNCYGEKKDLA